VKRGDASTYTSSRTKTSTKTAIIVGVLAVMASPAFAYDAATTHAGLTERSVLASGLHRVLARRLARPLGLFEPVALKLDHLPPEQARTFDYRLRTLDPAGGYRPTAGNVASALGWVEAWRGPCTHWVATDERGEVARVKVTDPSFLNWPGLVHAVPGNIIPDFPVINKSFNLSYSGNDR